MALIESFMVKTAYGLGAGEAVELKAKSTESLLIKDVIVDGENCNYCVFDIDRTTVGFFRLDKHPLKSHLPYIWNNFAGAQMRNCAEARSSITLISYMIEKGWMRGYPVAAGQTFAVAPYYTDESLENVIIVYEKYDAGDIKSTDPCGSESKEYIFVNYGRVDDSVTGSATKEVNVCMTAKEFPDFPIGASVPSKTTIELLGILGTEVSSYTDESNYVYTKYLQLFKGRTCLFDRDKRGLPFLGYIGSITGGGKQYGKGFSLIGNWSTYFRKPPFVPPTPLVFNEGDEVKVFVVTEGKGSPTALSVKDLEIAFIERVKIME